MIQRLRWLLGLPVQVEFWADLGTQIQIPGYAHPGDSGMDVTAGLSGEIELLPGERRIVPTGLFVAIPRGFEIQIRPRSGLAVTYGLTIPNTPATVDSGYRGEIKAPIVNIGTLPITVHPGLHIAQMVLAPVAKCSWRYTRDLPTSSREEGGFGSTGE